MPDRHEGFVRRGEGILPPNPQLALEYEHRATLPAILFAERIERILIDEALTACEKQGYRLHYVATEPTHVHMLVSWKMERPWLRVRSGLRSSLTRRLNRDFVRREWFSENGSRKRVKNQRHFDYLMDVYLPRHGGWKWREGVGYFR